MSPLCPFDADGAAPPSVLMREAPGPAERARLLLRMPDAVVLACRADIEAACEDLQFELGRRYLDARICALHATRDQCGVLGERDTQPLELWRSAMLTCAGVAP